jgi:ATP-dependent helicase/nuclease subunit B
MSITLKFPQVTPTDVFAHLAAGLKAGGTVVTPNRRLALALKREFDAAQAAQGLSLWDTADILPFPAFIECAYADVLYSGQATGLPILLTAAQEQALWEEAIRRADTALLAVAETARLAREAWQLAHAWQLLPQLRSFPLNEDGKAFQDWSQHYVRATERKQQTDSARLCDSVAGLWQHAAVKKPQRLICYGFDIITPQQATLLSKLEAAGCEVLLAQSQSQLRRHHGTVQRVAGADSRDEIQRAAVWARARLETDAAARIGIVVPDLARRRSAIMRIFSAVMEPDVQCVLPDVAQRTLPFNTSLGVALTSYPLVSTAFLLLELAGREIEFERASRLLRSPFIAGGETEMASRARLDARLRQRAEPVLTLDRLLMLIAHDGGSCPLLKQRLSALAEFRKANLFGAQTPSALAKAISAALQIVGFPGERSLDSAEYQTLKKWHAVIADFAALDNVIARTGYGEGLSRLRRMAAETLFQPETADVPIQILGVFEAAGMEFDHLWVMGLSDEVWPQPPRPNPFLPVELQRAAKLPQGSAAESLELARRLTADWLCSADEVILSYPRHSMDRGGQELMPSPLITHIAESEPALASIPAYASHRDLIHGTGQLEHSDDAKAPAFDQVTNAISGGTAVIKDQAACPFRALALHRLGAQSLQAPHTGLDARERGTLVHRVLAQAWKQLKSSSALAASSDDELEAILRQAAAEAIAHIRKDRPTTLTGRFAEIEQRRLVRLARAWLNADKERGDFSVIACEDKRSIEIGGLALTTRLDRVDELADGRRIVIDYKTRAPSVTTLLGERLDEPQLPLYLVTAEPDAAAVAFAQVRLGAMQFTALARDDDLLPGVKAFSESRQRERHGSWEELVAAWRIDLTNLAASFRSGDARVDPRKYPFTCRNCDMQPFCRIYERSESAFSREEE